MKASMTSFTSDETGRLMSYLMEHDPQMHVICLLAQGHALRRNEVLSLTAENFIDGRIIGTRLKGSKPFNHRLTPEEMKALEPVLTIRNDGRVLFDYSERQVNRLLVRYCKALGIHRTKAHMHSFKHTACRQILPVIGVNGVQQWAGHSEGKNSLIYLLPSQDELEARLDAGKAFAAKAGA